MLLLHNKHVDAEQVKYVHYGTVLQTDFTIGGRSGIPIPSGMMTIHIPDLGNNHVSEALPYPGVQPPPLGTQVSIGFDSDSNPIVISIYGAPESAGINRKADLRLLDGSSAMVHGYFKGSLALEGDSSLVIT